MKHIYTNYFRILHNFKKFNDHPWIKTYNLLTTREKAKIQANINFNNARMPCLDTYYTQELCYKSFLFLKNEEEPANLNKYFIHIQNVKYLTEIFYKVRRSKQKFFDLLKFHNQFLTETKDPGLAIIISNILLDYIGYPPYLFYSFDKMYDYPKDFFSMEKMEFETYYFQSLFYGYRFIKIHKKRGSYHNKNKILGKGAFAVVYRKNQREIIKVPRNMAGSIIENPLELYTLRKLKLFLPKNIPKLIKYNKKDNSIIKEFIHGFNGEQILKRQKNKLTSLQKHRLALLFKIIVYFIQKTGLYLDLSPLNFIWQDQKKDWVLIDAGPVPYELLKYFKTYSFSQYLSRGWLGRSQQKKRYPIRSFDENFYKWKELNFKKYDKNFNRQKINS